MGAFVEGASTFLVALGLERSVAAVVVAVLVISFAATSLDTGVRIQRYIIHELGDIYNIKILSNRYIAAAIAVLGPLALVVTGQEQVLWPLFGASNQLLAGLSLVVVTVHLYQQRRPWLLLGVPMALVLLVAGAALTVNLAEYWASGRYLLLALGLILLALELWVILEGIGAARRARAGFAGGGAGDR